MAASFIVFPSYIESYGLPLIEAASLGKKSLVVIFLMPVMF